MSKSTLLTLIAIGVGIAIAVLSLMNLSENEGGGAVASNDVDPMTIQLAECTAYYEISAKTIRRLGVQRMAMVADRLASSGVSMRAKLVAKTGESKASQLVGESTQRLTSMLPSPDQLGPLMQQFRQPCQQMVVGNS